MMRRPTLPKLMATMAVAGIALFLAAPWVEDIAASIRLAHDTDELLEAIAYARSEALQQGTMITICEGPGGWGAWVVTVAQPRNDQERDAPLRIGSGSALTVEGTAECAEFNPRGKLETTALDIALCDPGRHQGRKISVNPVGRAQAEAGPC